MVKSDFVMVVVFGSSFLFPLHLGTPLGPTPSVSLPDALPPFLVHSLSSLLPTLSCCAVMGQVG